MTTPPKELREKIENLVQLHSIDIAYAARRQKVGPLMQERQLFIQAILDLFQDYTTGMGATSKELEK